MTDDREVTIRITADTTGYKDGVADATKANKDFEAQTSKIGQRMRESWDKVGERIGLSTKKASDGMKGSKIGESFKSALGGKGLMDVLKLALKGVIAGVITAAAVAVVEMWGDLTKKFDTGLFEKQANKMNGAFTKLKTTVGAIVSPLYTIASNILTGIANGINTALEGVVTIYGYLAGLVGATGAISRNATEWSDSMEDATAAADAGLAAFDKLTTIGTEGMGDEAQAQRIRDLMADASVSGTKLRETIKETLNPLNLIGNFFANIGLERQWEGFTKAATSAWATASELGRSVWSSVSTWATESWSTTVQQATSAWDAITTGAGYLWGELSSTMSAKLSAMFGPALEGAKNLAGAIGSGIDTLMAIDLSETWGRMSEGFRSAWGGVVGGITGTISSLWDGLKEGFSAMWSGIVGAVSSTYSNIFAPLKTGISDTFATINTKVSGFVDKLAKSLATIPSRMADVFSSVWDGMAGGIKGVANGIIKVFNKVIGAYNSTIGKLRIENDMLGINIGFPSMSEIPMLAKGGIAEPNDPFLAVLGDNRKEKEFITPESTMRDVMRSVIEEQGGVRQTIEIPISLDGRVMARATYDYYSREAKRRGATWY